MCKPKLRRYIDDIIEEALLDKYGAAISEDIDNGRVRCQEFEDLLNCCSRVSVWLDGQELMRLLVADGEYEIL